MLFFRILGNKGKIWVGGEFGWSWGYIFRCFWGLGKLCKRGKRDGWGLG